MPETFEQDLSYVPQPLLLTLFLRAMESQRPDEVAKKIRAFKMPCFYDLEVVSG